MIFVIRGPMRRLVGFQKQVQLDADTVHDGLRALCLQYPELHNALLDGSGRLRGVHRIALNQQILHREQLETPVGHGDVLEVVTALAGG